MSLLKLFLMKNKESVFVSITLRRRKAARGHLQTVVSLKVGRPFAPPSTAKENSLLSLLFSLSFALSLLGTPTEAPWHKQRENGGSAKEPWTYDVRNSNKRECVSFTKSSSFGRV